MSPSQLALSIPEILEHILAFLSLKDRQIAAQFVCKRWRSICKGLAPVPFIWPLCLPDDENQTARGLIHLAHNITIRVFQSKHATERLASWAAMMGMISDALLERRQSKLRSLHVMEGVIVNLSVQLSQLPVLPNLTTLKIDRENWWDVMHLFTIFKKCPNLEELIIKPTWTTRYVHDNMSSLMDPSYEDALVNEAQVPMTRLRTCILYKMMVTIPALKVFLETCPRLSELILINIFRFNRADHRFIQLGDHQPIIDLIGTHCPTLKKLHFSAHDKALTDLEVTSILGHFPNFEEYSFSIRDAGPALLAGLRTVIANRVTTLNLLAIQVHQSTCLPTLRDILCTFIHLIHLRAPSMEYYHEDMDVNDVRGQIHARWNPSRFRHQAAMTEGPNGQYIWACRGLRTLHMTVGGRSGDTNSSYNALIMFGFLSRQCPQLQELHLRRTMVDLSFKGGLCLLTRLQELERVKITTGSDYELDEQALFWLRTTPSTIDRIHYPLLKLKTKRDCHNWVHRLPGTATSVRACWNRIIEDGQRVGVDLNNVGLREDLFEWMGERYGSLKLPTWPKLQFFSIETKERRNTSDTALQKLETFVANARPEAQVHIRHSPRDPFETSISQYTPKYYHLVLAICLYAYVSTLIDLSDQSTHNYLFDTFAAATLDSTAAMATTAAQDNSVSTVDAFPCYNASAPSDSAMSSNRGSNNPEHEDEKSISITLNSSVKNTTPTHGPTTKETTTAATDTADSDSFVWIQGLPFQVFATPLILAAITDCYYSVLEPYKNSSPLVLHKGQVVCKPPSLGKYIAYPLNDMAAFIVSLIWILLPKGMFLRVGKVV
ncbi:hypothetical protein BG015_005949 [Linnemannia schmuckeri]|uniref:F-box domain-containing protein n=1 Tax=Linnemannia schmuckeri TaxID=64567 RepID=A0A9P5VCB3_9FUNG|nr:hypothetical protein BG015_005949 [Linnemannia schmuckeri]